MIDTPLEVPLVIANIGLGGLLVAGLAYVARAERNPSIVAGGAAAVTVWLGLAIALAADGAFESTPTTELPPVIAAGIAVPTILGCALLASATFRRWLARVPLHWLVGVQVYRVVGAVFLIAYLQDDMPAQFALPAGIGDVLVGLLAPVAAYALLKQGPRRARGTVLTWCAVGIGDLVVAVTMGFLTAPSAFQQLALDAPNAAITSYPFVLIPVFAVPASIVLHVYVIARLRAQPAPAGSRAAHPRPA